VSFRAVSGVVLSGSRILLQTVHFHEGNSGEVVYTTDDRSVVACWQIRDDKTRRLKKAHCEKDFFFVHGWMQRK